MVIQSMNLKEKVISALKDVKDPEIASVSILDLGMIEDVEEREGSVLIKALPTFVGCPALHIIERDVKQAACAVEGVKEVHVEFVYTPAWTTDRITEEGKERLKEFGIAPPPANHVMGEPWCIDCPYCGSSYVTMENIFGPTACRSILYCKSCKNPFEAMKPVADMN
ncbi:phenylacetate-CoA oxygenase subunit PaaJ [Fictibacillus sp. KIGAM418]|uniref:Phenylacetate-CoA oxygenase subunit PaaJ n=1 Tax=Fictibacillus marinisediminis TaxID=2878389 RepID=A0A9X2BBX9_9BACL|nr:1,2-phenylacetyl-CoA epoxidase subunit PaaD [Fictibacillus marinisediminis]MCK6255911.1 phenylacetate-CoA oxygenase subunit PaaJ [Fictibacillus marinisediminis]